MPYDLVVKKSFFPLYASTGRMVDNPWACATRIARSGRNYNSDMRLGI